MSKSFKGKQHWSVPGYFKRFQIREQKQKQKESDRLLFDFPEEISGIRFRNSHKWEYF
jgi:hypothetical protein